MGNSHRRDGDGDGDGDGGPLRVVAAAAERNQKKVAIATIFNVLLFFRIFEAENLLLSSSRDGKRKRGEEGGL